MRHEFHRNSIVERPPQVGDLCPSVSIPIDGRSVPISELRGSPVVLAFGPSDWNPARPHQLGFYRDALARLAGLRNVEERDSGITGELEDGQPISLPVVHDLPLDGELARMLGGGQSETVIVIDGDGILRFRHEGAFGTLPSADQIVESLTASITSTKVSRRSLLLTSAAVLVAVSLISPIAEAFTAEGRQGGGLAATVLNVNGRSYPLPDDPRVTLLDALRERIGLTGTKKGCDHGQCGACTVIVEGRRVNSCLTLAHQAAGKHVLTVEGLADGDRLHPVQEAFIKHDGFQCGYCTSGQIMSAVACIKEGHTRSREEIQEWMSGNICRCGAYVGICEAVAEAARHGGAA